MQKSWNNIWITILISILSGMYIAIVFVNPYGGRIPLAELVLQLSGSRGEFCLGCSLTELVEYMLLMIPGYIIMMVLGNNLYGHFCTASIYVFSRCPDRLKWYGKTVAVLFGEVCLFETVFVGVIVTITEVRYSVDYTLGGVLMLGYHMLIYVLWIYAWVLFINLCALKVGSSVAFMTAMGIQMVCTAGLVTVHILEIKDASWSIIEKIMVLNPIAHTVVGWHRSGILAKELAGSRYSLKLWSSILLFSLFCMIALLAGRVMVDRHDLLIEDMELGVI